MLFQLGASVFEVYPLNTHEGSFDSEMTFVEKSVMGRRPPLEKVGEGADTRSLQCRLFPAKFGGLSDIDGLQSQRQAGVALPMMRGDGTPLGWYVIEKVSEKSTLLDANGVGQVIEVDISLRRSDPPNDGQMFSMLAGLIS
jgi:phage protein U